VTQRAVVSVTIATVAGLGEAVLGTPHNAVLYAVAVLTGIFIGRTLK
jgi:hypothetical protein